MKKKLPVIVLGILCAVLAVMLLNSNQENARLKLQLIASEMTSSSPAPVIAAQEATSDFQPLEEPPATSDAEAETEKLNSQQRVMRSVANMMNENPTMNKIVEASQRGVMNALYSDLVEYLDLNTEETKYFMDLLMHRQMKNVEMAMKMMSGQVSEDEQAAMTEEVKNVGKIIKDEMKNFLNSEDDYAEYEFYEKTIGERMLLSQVDAKLTGTDSALSEDTYKDVLNIMHEERENFTFTNNLGDNENVDMSAERFSQANIDLYMEETLEMGANINQRLETILTEEQMAAYLDSGESMLNLQASQLQQAKQIFGGK